MEESEFTAGMYILSYFTKFETSRQKKRKGEIKGNENIFLKFIQYSYFPIFCKIHKEFLEY